MAAAAMVAAASVEVERAGVAMEEVERAVEESVEAAMVEAERAGVARATVARELAASVAAAMAGVARVEVMVAKRVEGCRTDAAWATRVGSCVHRTNCRARPGSKIQA
jgi:hypothetical protein